MPVLLKAGTNPALTFAPYFAIEPKERTMSTWHGPHAGPHDHQPES